MTVSREGQPVWAGLASLFVFMAQMHVDARHGAAVTAVAWFLGLVSGEILCSLVTQSCRDSRLSSEARRLGCMCITDSVETCCRAVMKQRCTSLTYIHYEPADTERHGYNFPVHAAVTKLQGTVTSPASTTV